MADPREPTPLPVDKDGGDLDVSTDVAPPSTGAPADGAGEGGMRGEDDRTGGMGGEG